MPASAHKSLIACTYGGSNEVTVSKSTLLTSSAFSYKCLRVCVKMHCRIKINHPRKKNSKLITKCDFRIWHYVEAWRAHTYRVIWWAILNFEYVHGTNHGLHCHKYVLEYQLNEATFIFIGITTTVDNSHLFDKCRFARFTSTCFGFQLENVSFSHLFGEMFRNLKRIQ